MSTNQTALAEQQKIEPPPKPYDRVTLRAVIVAIILTVVNDYWLVQLEVVRYSYPTYAAPFYNVIFTLLILTGINLLIRKKVPRLAFTRIEMLTVYVMLSVSGTKYLSTISIRDIPAYICRRIIPHGLCRLSAGRHFARRCCLLCCV